MEQLEAYSSENEDSPFIQLLPYERQRALTFQDTKRNDTKPTSENAMMKINEDKSKSKEKSDECYLQELITALGDFYYTMIIEKDEETLLRFLRHTNYDVQESVKFVHSSENFVRMQEHLLRIPFGEITPLFDHEGILVFKQPDHKGHKVVLIQVRFWDIDVNDIDHVTVALSYGVDELMKSVEIQRNGFIFIIDCSGIGHIKAAYILSKITRQQIMLGIKAYQYTFPVKIKEIFVLHVPLVAAATYNAFKYFIQKKLRDRIHINSSFKDLQKYFSKDFLPEVLMGNVPDDECQDHDFFDRLRKRKCRFAKFQPF